MIDWDARIARANTLARALPFAGEILRFYAAIAGFQRDGGDYPELVRLVRRVGPPGLADQAPLDPDAAMERYLLRQPQDAAVQFFARVLLQARPLVASGPAGQAQACPTCGHKPQAGVLRVEGLGGKRSLICSLCSEEWEYPRVSCPGCGETAPGRLLVYTAELLPHVRVETCDTCRQYSKTIDLTRDGHAVPIVDELASIPLDLWARERGYRCLQPNLLAL